MTCVRPGTRLFGKHLQFDEVFCVRTGHVTLHRNGYRTVLRGLAVRQTECLGAYALSVFHDPVPEVEVCKIVDRIVVLKRHAVGVIEPETDILI